MKRVNVITLAWLAWIGLIAFTAYSFSLPPDPVLQLYQTNVVDLCVVDGQASTPAPVTADGGTGIIVVTNLFTGLAWALHADNLSGPFLIECSTDLSHWVAFPKPGLQLTLLPETPTAVVTVPAGSRMFFRGHY